MSRITIVRPPAVYSRKCYSVSLVPPLGAAYLAGALRAAGHQVQLIDAIGEAPAYVGDTARANLVHYGLPNGEIVDRIDPEVDGVAFTSMFTVQWPHTQDLIEAVAATFPNIPMIVGGEHATASWSFILAECPAVDAVGLGEGEETIVEWADSIEHGIPLSQVSGIAVRGSSGPQLNPPRARRRDVDNIPRPAWDLVPLANYHHGGFTYSVDRGKSIPLLATRGCPYQCTFCSSPAMWTTRYICRDAVDVVDEIETYVEAYGIENVDFYDLTAIIKRDWILSFCAELRRRPWQVTYQLPTGTRSEALDAEVLQALRDTGCRSICYAPESGSERTLKQINKRVKLAHITASMRMAKSLDMTVKSNLIIGFPDERRIDMWRSVWFGVKLAWFGVDDIPLFPFSPYPGSELYDRLRREGRVAEPSNDWFADHEYTDLWSCKSYCRHVGTHELRAVQFFGMSLFIVVGYLRRPWRVLRTLKSLFTRKGNSVTEQRLIDISSRLKAKLSSVAAPAAP